MKNINESDFYLLDSNKWKLVDIFSELLDTKNLNSYIQRDRIIKLYNKDLSFKGYGLY